MKRFFFALLFLVCLPGALRAATEPVSAGEPMIRPRGFGVGNEVIRLSGRMQSLFLWRNDRDFDRTAPYYDAQGQEVGILGTFIAPYLEITPVSALRMVLEMEIGLNIWSKQDPDNYTAGDDRFFRMAIRQLYMEGDFFDGKLGFRVGYEQMFDLSGLFLGHWLGVASLRSTHDWGTLSLSVAQVPDQTYEGVAFDDNNFTSDTLAYGLRGDFPLGKHLTLSASLWGLHDTQIVDQALDLATFTAKLAGDWQWLSFALDAGFQYGVTEHRAAGADETTIAWSFQGSLDVRHPVSGALDLLVHFNTLALSGDDEYDGNDHNGAWFYSGKSRSRTLILTEDDLRDRGGNLDEQLAERRQGDSGKFYSLRPGLSVTDLSVGVEVLDFFRPMLTVGAGFVLEPENALGKRFVGVETDLHLEFLYERYLSFDLVGAVLVPGEAAAVFANRTDDRAATDAVYQVEAVMTMWF